MRRSFYAYAAVGAVATAVHWITLVVLVRAGLLAPPWAAAAGACVGAQVAYAGNACLTFREMPARFRNWWRFQAVAAVGAATSATVVGAGVAVGVHFLLAQALATVLTLCLTYEINRRWSFVSSSGPS